MNSKLYNRLLPTTKSVIQYRHRDKKKSASPPNKREEAEASPSVCQQKRSISTASRQICVCFPLPFPIPAGFPASFAHKFGEYSTTQAACTARDDAVEAPQSSNTICPLPHYDAAAPTHCKRPVLGCGLHLSVSLIPVTAGSRLVVLCILAVSCP